MIMTREKVLEDIEAVTSSWGRERPATLQICCFVSINVLEVKKDKALHIKMLLLIYDCTS